MGPRFTKRDGARWRCGGLLPTAPGANPPGWGLAWLLGAAGDVLDVSPGAIGMRFHPNGVRLALHCRAGRRGGIMPAWKL